MSRLADDGSLILSPEETDRLRGMVRRWHVGAHLPGSAAGDAVLDLACEVRELLDMEPGQ